MGKTTIDYGEVVRSIRDLTGAYKPTESKARSFVEWFVKKYRVSRGYENELTAIVLDEIKKMNGGKRE